MEQDELIRQHLLASLKGRNAHISFEETIKEFPKSKLNTKIEGIKYSSWELVEHMRIAQWDILEFIRNPAYQARNWPEDYWPNEQGSASKWEKAIEQFLRDRKTLENYVKDRNMDIYSPIPHAPDYTIFREIVLVIDHNSYHTGQLVLLRKSMGIWPK